MMDAVDPVHPAVEMNRQLQERVQRKQVEISALREQNAHLSQLLTQTQIYAALHPVFMPQPDDTSGCASLPAPAFAPHSCLYSSFAEPAEQHCGEALQPSWLESLLDHTPPQEEPEWSHKNVCVHTNTGGVKRQLWPSDESSSADGPDKKSRLVQEFYDQSHEHSPSDDPETVQVYGSFHGLRVLKATPSANSDFRREGERCTFFKTSIREHSTVRTRVFPHGKTFTSHTPDGDCRFLWVPQQN